MVGGLIASFGCFAASYANSIGELCFSFGIVSGFGLSMVFVPAVVVVAFYFEKKRAFATGIAVAGSGIGTFIFAPLTEYLIEHYHWRGAFMITSGVMLNTVVCGAIFRPLTSENVNMRRKTHRRKSSARVQERERVVQANDLSSNNRQISQEDESVVIELQSEAKVQYSYAERMKQKLQQNLSNIRLFRISETSNDALENEKNSGDEGACDVSAGSDSSSTGSSSSSSSSALSERLFKSEPILASEASKNLLTKKRNFKYSRNKGSTNIHKNCNSTSRQSQNLPPQLEQTRSIVSRKFAKSTTCVDVNFNYSNRGRETQNERKTGASDHQFYRYTLTKSLSATFINATVNNDAHRGSLNSHPHYDDYVSLPSHHYHHHHHNFRNCIISQPQHCGSDRCNAVEYYTIPCQLPDDDDQMEVSTLVAAAPASAVVITTVASVAATSEQFNNATKSQCFHVDQFLKEQNSVGANGITQRPSCHFIDCTCSDCSSWRHFTSTEFKPTSKNNEKNVNIRSEDNLKFNPANTTSQLPLVIKNKNTSPPASTLFDGDSDGKYASSCEDNIRSVNSLDRGHVGDSSNSDRFIFITARQDMVYRGSLLRTGFFLNHGRSASCPEVCMTPSKRNRHRQISKNNFLTTLLCCCDDETDCEQHNFNTGYSCGKKCQLSQQMGANKFSLGKLVKNTFNRFNQMVDLSVFKSPVFALFNLHTVFLYLSYDIPYVYGPVRASDFDISDSDASILVAILGIFSMMGQVVMGYLGDLPCLNVTSFYNTMTAIAGVMVLFVPLVTTFLPMGILYAGYGFFISANFALTTVILVELLGMERLTNAFGIVSLAQGVANLVGPPLAGWLSDRTMSFDLAFYGAGFIILISGLMLFLTPCLEKCDNHGKKFTAAANASKRLETNRDQQHHDNCDRTGSSEELVLVVTLESEAANDSIAQSKTALVGDTLKTVRKCIVKESNGRKFSKNSLSAGSSVKTPEIIITEALSIAEEEEDDDCDEDKDGGNKNKMCENDVTK